MLKPSFLIAAFVLFFMAPAPASAQGTQPITTVELSADMVTGFIASIPTLKAVMQKYDGQIPKNQRATSGSPLAAMQGYAAYRQIKAEMDGAVAGFGFASYEDWMAVAQTTMVSLVYLKTAGARAQAGPAMAAALRAMEANKSISEAQKAQIRERMKMAMTAAPGMPTPSDNNLEIVRAMGPQIEAAMRTMSSRN